MSGFVALYREAFEHPMLQDAERFRAWFWLVAHAAWKPTKARIKGDMVELQRGELTFSVRFLADKWGWSKSRVDRFIADLRAEGMIATRSKIGTPSNQNAGQGQSIITICNYDEYQSVDDDKRDNSGTQSGTTAGQQRDKEEQDNKITSNIPAPKNLRPYDVSEQVWADYQALRKAKRAPITQTVLDTARREAEKAGWTLEAALTECVVRGWQGFKAEWLTNTQQQRPNAPQGQTPSFLDHIRQRQEASR